MNQDYLPSGSSNGSQFFHPADPCRQNGYYTPHNPSYDQPGDAANLSHPPWSGGLPLSMPTWRYVAAAENLSGQTSRGDNFYPSLASQQSDGTTPLVPISQGGQPVCTTVKGFPPRVKPSPYSRSRPAAADRPMFPMQTYDEPSPCPRQVAQYGHRPSSHYHPQGQPMGQPNFPPGNYLQSGHAPERVLPLRNTSGSAYAPINASTAPLHTDESSIWTPLPPKSVKIPGRIPESHHGGMPMRFEDNHGRRTPSATPKVPALEQPKSTSHSQSDFRRHSPILEQYEANRTGRTAKPRKHNSGRKRNLTAEGREHAKLVRQSPGGACGDCKRKKIKARTFDGIPP